VRRDTQQLPLDSTGRDWCANLVRRAFRVAASMVREDVGWCWAKSRSDGLTQCTLFRVIFYFNLFSNNFYISVKQFPYFYLG
jgi:hypothetical protein